MTTALPAPAAQTADPGIVIYTAQSSRKPKIRRPKFPILGEVQDVGGSTWHVREVRNTKHGFDLLFGSPESQLGSYPGGLPRLIATQPLVDFWEANRAKHDGVLYDLPAGRTTLKRMRHHLGFHSLKDQAEFWQERIEDLKFLPAREFARRHNVDPGVVFDTRTRLLGPRSRKRGWWRVQGVVNLLQSNLKLRELGEIFEISASQAHRLRLQARAYTTAAAPETIPAPHVAAAPQPRDN